MSAKKKGPKSRPNQSDVNQEDLWRLINLRFHDRTMLYQHQIESYDFFIDHAVQYEVQNNCVIDEHEDTEKKFYVTYKFEFENFSFRPATLDNNEYMTPMIARHRGLSYFGTFFADVRQVQEKTDLVTDEVTRVVIGEEKAWPVARLPIMVKSKYCVTRIVPEVLHEECPYDPGCYTIVNGGEKVILAIEKMAPNKVFVFVKKKDAEVEFYKAMIQCQRNDIDGISYLHHLTMKMKVSDGSIVVSSSQFNEIPLVILLRSLGLETDYDISLAILQKPIDQDLEMNNHIVMFLKQSVDEKGGVIRTMDEARNYMLSKIMTPRIYSTDPEYRNRHKRLHLEKILNTELYPHTSPGIVNKARFAVYMIRRLLLVAMGRVSPDDRDTYVNKRIEMPGILLGQLFRQNYGKMMKDCSSYFRKKNLGDDNPLKVINQIKPITTEQSMKSALLTGKWGMIKSKNGVARPLERLSYLRFVSEFRRIITPAVDEKNSKMTSMRHVHPSQLGFVCIVETPEGEKIGLVKNLSVTSTITTPSLPTSAIIKDMSRASPVFLPFDGMPMEEYEKNYKLLVNGDWLGFVTDPGGFFREFTQHKLHNRISRYTGLCLDVTNREVRIVTDGGRMVRPLLRIEDLEPALKKEMVTHKYADWEAFMMKYPEAIEFVDVEQSAYSLIAMKIADVHQARELRDDGFQGKGPKSNDKLNRYINAYNPYTHCELHASLTLGMTVTSIPFCNMNQAPRNSYQYNQAKQAMGLYATNFKNRFDISNVLYTPQVPVVVTRGMEYTCMTELPNGENVIVAIACFTGYNQEDSMVLNKTSVDRGLFLSSYLRKYNSTIEKNQVSSQDDIHAKPDPNLVMNMKADVNYEKLNDRGYVPEETVVENGDAIMGKISPITPSEKSNKIFKDRSEVYKGYHKAVIDKVQTGMVNSDGYEMYNMRIRCKRVPQIGDKFSSRSGQKSTVGLLIPQEDMPFTESGMVPDMVINPNCIPGRMTIAQLLECVTGKVGAVKCQHRDGTVFEERDTDSICAELEALGFHRHGYETMYSGVSGKKLRSMIFIGPTFYQRLKHMVADKIHARATGPMVMLTRQPPEGRTKNGGLRFGEMERDVAISHGMSVFLKERLMECSDKYDCRVCNKCGLIASRMKTSENYFCNSCDSSRDGREGNSSDVSLVQIPYAFKLMIQELMAINIVPRIGVEKEADAVASF